MYRIVDGRGSGKTSRLMILAKETHGTIICSNPHAMEQKARAYGLIGINFMSYHDFLNSKDEKLDNYYIDELEAFAQYVAWESAEHGNFTGYTLSLE